MGLPTQAVRPDPDQGLEYEVVWNGIIDKERQTADQRLPFGSNWTRPPQATVTETVLAWLQDHEAQYGQSIARMIAATNFARMDVIRALTELRRQGSVRVVSRSHQGVRSYAAITS